MIHGIDVLCIVRPWPSRPIAPMPQYLILQWLTTPCSLSHGPIVRESTVAVSMVPLSVVPRPHCPIVALSIVPLSIAAWSTVPTSHCPIVSLPHCPLVLSHGTCERSSVPLSQCAFVPASIIPLSIVPLFCCPTVLLSYCSFVVEGFCLFWPKQNFKNVPCPAPPFYFLKFQNLAFLHSNKRNFNEPKHFTKTNETYVFNESKHLILIFISNIIFLHFNTCFSQNLIIKF
jgi:hypothetical protein